MIDHTLGTSRLRRHTKIVATLGPASNTPEMIRKLIDAGMNVARINGSHGNHGAHAELIQNIRAAAVQVGRPIGILFDLQGPKIRIGNFDGPPVQIKTGETFDIAVGRAPKKGELPSDYALLDEDAKVGEPLLIDDGSLASEVIFVEKGLVRCRACNDASIEQRKGINLPKSAVSAPALSEKDRADALFAAAHGVDAIALSFVRQAQDIQELKDLLKQAGFHTPIIAKIEKPQALDNLEDIVASCWGVMVARGDLGVELAPEDVPMSQKRIIKVANGMARPVITATQMLDSMRLHPRPTRAEASDVCNAVIDGTDAVMLSAETAMGKYPIEAVTMMGRIIRTTEKATQSSTNRLQHSVVNGSTQQLVTQSTPDAIADASCQVAQVLDSQGIIAFTRTGTTALLVAKRRPLMPVLAFTPNTDVQNLLTFAWGVRTYFLPNVERVDDRIEQLDHALTQGRFAERGQLVVIAMGSPTAEAGHTTLMLVHRVGDAALS